MEAELIDRIYECCFVPEFWPQVLRDASKITDSTGACLFITNPEITSWTSSRNVHDFVARFVAEGWYWRGNLMKRVHGARHAGFVRDVDICTAEELEAEPIYRDSWSRVGVGYGAATCFALPDGQSLAIVMPRMTAKGPADAAAIERLDLLRPHLGRAALMAARMRLERARAASDALATIGLAAMVLEETGKVLAVNRLIESMTGVATWRAFDRVTLMDKAADELFRDALAKIALPDNVGVRSFPVHDAATRELLVGHVIPIRLSARDIFARSVAVFVLAPVVAPDAPPVELVRSLFDLTPSEARVAHSLASGKTVDDIASDSGVSANTVRVQVRGVLEKTGCHRQVDVVALLAGISAARPSPRS
jgi:DNA-binding CsgD family transcriptional regulator